MKPGQEPKGEFSVDEHHDEDSGVSDEEDSELSEIFSKQCQGAGCSANSSVESGVASAPKQFKSLSTVAFDEDIDESPEDSDASPENFDEHHDEAVMVTLSELLSEMASLPLGAVFFVYKDGGLHEVSDIDSLEDGTRSCIEPTLSGSPYSMFAVERSMSVPANLLFEVEESKLLP